MSYPPSEPGPSSQPPPGPWPGTDQPPDPARVGRGGAVTRLLVVLTVVFFLAAAGVTTLFLLDKKSSDRTIARQKAEIAQLQQDARAKADELAKTTADLNTAKGKAETLQTQVDKHAACNKAVQDFFTALNKNDDAAGERAVLALVTNCEGVKVDF
jgi:septal ring factor EnvC (AmiA/AmiB activator)